MKKLLILLILTGCKSHDSTCTSITGAQGPQGEQGLPGKDGTNGTNGQDAKSCTISAATNGALIVCPDGSQQFIPAGTTGPIGPKGNPGKNGSNGSKGDPGKDGVSIAFSVTPDIEHEYCSGKGNIIKIWQDVDDDNFYDPRIDKNLHIVPICDGVDITEKEKEDGKSDKD